MPRIIGELMLKNLASQWLPGDQLYWEGGPLVMATEGVWVIVSTDWSVLGMGLVDQCIWS